MRTLTKTAAKDIALFMVAPIIGLAYAMLFPFVALVLLSCLTAVLAFGDPRFAVDGDVAVALLAGVALDAGAGAAARRWSTGPGRHSAGRVVTAP